MFNGQRHLEELEQCMLALEQEPCDPDKPRISDSKAVSDGDDERYETVGSCLAARSIVQQKVKHQQLMAQGRTSSRGPWCEITTYWPYIQAELVNLGK